MKKVIERINNFTKKHKRLFGILGFMFWLILPFVTYFYVYFYYCFESGVLPTMEEMNTYVSSAFAGSYALAFFKIFDLKRDKKHLNKLIDVYESERNVNYKESLK